jgi:hypothetical protein
LRDLTNKNVDENYENKHDKDPMLSEAVVSTVPNRTPAQLAAETPEETAARYGPSASVTKEDIANPKIQVYSDSIVKQVPSGTHLHPDIALDLQNRGIAQATTESARVTHVVTHEYDFAGDDPNNDKFVKPVEDDDDSGIEDSDVDDDGKSDNKK